MRITRVIAVSVATGALALTGGPASALAWGGGEDFGFHRDFREHCGFRDRGFRDDFRFDRDRRDFHRDWGWDRGGWGDEE